MLNRLRLLVLAAVVFVPPGFAVTPQPGGAIEYQVELPDSLRPLLGPKAAAVKRALCRVAVPADYDPAKPGPVLVVSATTGRNGAASSRRLAERFTPPALAEGWIVIAADADQPIPPEADTNTLRYALAKAALAGFETVCPALRHSPLAFGGFSGGAKRSAWLAALAVLDGYHPIGVFQGGCNEPAMADALRQYRPDRKQFLALPVFLSSGDEDTIAPPEVQEEVRDELEHQGFTAVRIERYLGGHQLDPGQVTHALRWFRPAPAKAGPGK